MGKSYNPFKLWGGYIGSILAIVFTLIYGSGSLPYIRGYDSLYYLGYYLALPLHIIAGFLVGWGIHSIFRALRK